MDTGFGRVSKSMLCRISDQLVDDQPHIFQHVTPQPDDFVPQLHINGNMGGKRFCICQPLQVFVQQGLVMTGMLIQHLIEYVQRDQPFLVGQRQRLFSFSMRLPAEYADKLLNAVSVIMQDFLLLLLNQLFLFARPPVLEPQACRRRQGKASADKQVMALLAAGFQLGLLPGYPGFFKSGFILDFLGGYGLYFFLVEITVFVFIY